LKIETRYSHGRTQVAPQQAPSHRKTTAKPHHQTNPRYRLKIPLTPSCNPYWHSLHHSLFSFRDKEPVTMSRRNFLLASLPHPFTASTEASAVTAMAFIGISTIM